jgi:hypothetical protein
MTAKTQLGNLAQSRFYIAHLQNKESHNKETALFFHKSVVA